MLEIFRFIKCLMMAINRNEPRAELLASFGAFCLSVSVVLPVTLAGYRIIFTNADRLWLEGSFPILHYPPFKYLPFTIISFLLFSPAAYSIFHSRAGKQAQARYNERYLAFVQENIPFLQKVFVIVGTFYLVMAGLLIKVGAVVSISASVVFLAVISLTLKKYLRPVVHVE